MPYDMKKDMLVHKGYSEAGAEAKSMKTPKGDGLVDMRLPKKKRESPEAMTSPSYEKYPYGLRVDLDNDAMKMLDMDLPDVGKTMTLTAKVTVERAEMRESNEGKRSSCCLQITRMKVV